MNDRDTQFTYRLVFGALFGVVPIAIALIVASAKLGPASIGVWACVAGAAWMISRGPIGEAVAQRIKGGADQGELLEQTLAELDDLRSRLAELEERQDFSERLLPHPAERAPVEASK